MENAIFLNGMRLKGYHGVEAQERKVGNTFVYDVVLYYDFQEAARTDTISRTVSYAEIASIVKEVNSVTSLLLENVAWRLVDALRRRYPLIKGGEVKVEKIAPPIAGADISSAAVSIKF